MRLIDAEKAYEEVVDLSGQASTKSAYAAFWKAGKIIKKLPTVDAVEVVRCKDCKYFANSFDPGREKWCSNLYGLEFTKVSGNDFCSYGERRSDNA